MWQLFSLDNMINWTWHKFETLTALQVYNILALRQKIFILEQRCFYPDIDYKDQQGLHLLGIKNDRLVGYLRFLPKGIAYPNDASFGRIITIPSQRGLGLGKIMMQKLLTFFDENYNSDSMLIMAQLYLQPFYEGFGFQSIGEAFDEDGIMHINMQRSIKNQTNKK